MELKTPKDLKALAEACRKAGLSSFKGFGVEFTLGEAPTARKRTAKVVEAPEATSDDFMKAVKKAKAAAVAEPQAEKSNTPTEMEMLFWSSGEGPIPAEDEGSST